MSGSFMDKNKFYFKVSKHHGTIKIFDILYDAKFVIKVFLSLSLIQNYLESFEVKGQKSKYRSN